MKSQSIALRHFESTMNRAVRWIGTALLFLQFAIVLCQVLARLFRHAFPWAEEASQLLLICLVFIGSAIVQRSNSHIKVDFLFMLLPPTMKRVVAMLLNFLLLITLGSLLVGLFLLMPFAFTFFTPGGQIPLWWMYFFVGVGVIWWLLQVLYSMLGGIRSN